MPPPLNILKHRLAQGDVTYGCMIGLADAYTTEIAASAGFDWLLLDGEHAPNDIRSLSGQLAVVLPSRTAAIVRLRDDDPAAIKQALDIGAQTLMIPMVDSAEQAARVVRATRYPPEGIRGVGAMLARASGFGAVPDYVVTANSQICLLVQVESRAGMAALDAILAVDGVDGVFLGPADLAADMGYPGQSSHPEVRATVLDLLRRIRSAGRIAGVLSTEADFIAECRAAGANVLGVGIDVITFAAAMRALAARHR